MRVHHIEIHTVAGLRRKGDGSSLIGIQPQVNGLIIFQNRIVDNDNVKLNLGQFTPK